MTIFLHFCRMRKLIFTLLCWALVLGAFAQSLTLASWNIADLGRTKSAEELQWMARIINQYDVVAIQEVVAKDPRGAQAVAQIVDELNRMGAGWDYRVSPPTASSSSAIRERYAFIWRTSKCRFLRAGLDTRLSDFIEREPYWLELRVAGFPQPLWLSNFHSRPYNQEPEAEIRFFTEYPSRVAPEPMILLGDWNLDETHPVWGPFYALGYAPAVRQTPTTLKRACSPEGGYRNHAIDNIFYPTDRFRVVAAGVTDFVQQCRYLDRARGLSDHLPVWVELEPVEEK